MAIALNIPIDTYSVYSSLFNPNKSEKIKLGALCFNQHIYNAELIFRNPERFDSFLFGSSRTGVIDTSKITTGRFYNMSYPSGLLEEHLAIIKTFLKKGIRIKNIVIGLDEFTFTARMRDREDQLLYIMHPDVSGKSRTAIFLKYFIRMPPPIELSSWLKVKHLFKPDDEIKLFDDNGLNIAWLNYEKEIADTREPFFKNPLFVYTPFIFDQQLVDDVYCQIDELKKLARKNNFNLMFFFNPIYSQTYVNYAKGFLSIKKNMVKHTDFYDFSGFHAIIIDSLNYYDHLHYRYRIGNMIVRKIVENNPDDFGILITKDNVENYINRQEKEMEKYLFSKSVRRGQI